MKHLTAEQGVQLFLQNHGLKAPASALAPKSAAVNRTALFYFFLCHFCRRHIKCNITVCEVTCMAFSSRELLARIIKCEAGGEGDNGMKAVATVVMNRVHVPNGEYQRIGQGDLRRIIYQQGQFDCVAEVLGGQYNPQNIYNMTPDQVHYDIADWALSGNKILTIGYALWYFNPFQPVCPQIFPRNGTGTFANRIALHCFYNPTRAYYLT